MTFKVYLRFCVGTAVLLSSIALLIYAVKPAYGSPQSQQEYRFGNETQMSIKYINVDSLNLQFLGFVELEDSAAGLLNNQFDIYQKLAAELNQRYQTLQYKVATATISADEATKEEKEINAGLDRLRKMESSISDVESGAMSANDSISLEVAHFISDYSKSRNIQFILMYGTGMPIIYADKNMDITNEIVDQLNALHRKKNQGK